jgi:hypothetical protein
LLPEAAKIFSHFLFGNKSIDYPYCRPGLHTPFYDPAALEMTVIDPFGNRLTYVERQ